MFRSKSDAIELIELTDAAVENSSDGSFCSRGLEREKAVMVCIQANIINVDAAAR